MDNSEIVGSMYGVIDEAIDVHIFCIRLEVSIVLKSAARGMAISIPEEVMTIDLYRMDSSLDSSEVLLAL